jgi:DNA-binding beta-propeller fold protein YncE
MHKFVCALALLVAVDAHAAGYQVTKTVTLGGPDTWDYLAFDAASGRVVAAHGDRIAVVDGKDGTIVGQVEGVTANARGVAIAGGRVYTDDAKADTVGWFDLRTLAPGKVQKTVGDPDAMTADPKSGHVYVIGSDSGRVAVLDPAKDAIVGEVEVGGTLEAGAADGKGRLYVNVADKREVVRIDLKTRKVDARWPLTECESPHGMALDVAADRLFTSCVNQRLVVLDTKSGKQVASLAIGKGSDGVVFDAKRKLLFSANGGDGTLSVLRAVSPDHYEPVGTVPTHTQARTLTLDPASGRLYLIAVDLVPGEVDAKGRPKRAPGSVKLLFVDPVSS